MEEPDSGDERTAVLSPPISEMEAAMQGHVMTPRIIESDPTPQGRVLTPRVVDGDLPRARIQSEPDSLREEYVLTDMLREVQRRRIGEVSSRGHGVWSTMQSYRGSDEGGDDARPRLDSYSKDEATETDIALFDRATAPPPSRPLWHWLAGGFVVGVVLLLLVALGSHLTAPDHTAVDLHVSPPEAEVEADGEKLQHPAHHTLACDGSLTITLRAPGYVTERHHFRCGADVVLHVALEPFTAH